MGQFKTSRLTSLTLPHPLPPATSSGKLGTLPVSSSKTYHLLPTSLPLASHAPHAQPTLVDAGLMESAPGELGAGARSRAEVEAGAEEEEAEERGRRRELEEEMLGRGGGRRCGV